MYIDVIVSGHFMYIRDVDLQPTFSWSNENVHFKS
jgi:hypothetical protein